MSLQACAAVSMQHNPPICPYCDKPARLVTGARLFVGRENVAHKHFWWCEPCDAYVGCYENSPTHKPVGRLADTALRKAKREFHGVFDILYLAGFERLSRIRGGRANKQDCRSVAYKWLATHMGIDIRYCNVGAFDLEQCLKAKKICETLGNELLHKFQTEGDRK